MPSTYTLPHQPLLSEFCNPEDNDFIMQLLDLPPEIFSHIAQELVSVAGPRSAWKLRLVCRTFAEAIHYDIFAKRSAEQIRSCRASKIIESNIPLFLANRTKLPLGEDPYLPSLIKEMVQFFSKGLKATRYAQQEHLLKTVCECVNRSMHSSQILWMLVGYELPMQEWLRRDPKERMKITIAAALGQLCLVRKWLPSISMLKDHRYQCFSRVFGHPLVNAAAYGHRDVFDYLTGTGLSLLLGSDPQLAPSSDRYGYLSMSDILNAALEAIQRQDLDMTRSIFEIRCSLLRNQLAKPSYNRCLDSAVRTGDVRFVDLIKTKHPRHGSNVTLNQFVTACKGGNVAIVKALLGAKGMSPDSTFSLTTPLVAAVRSGHLDIVAAVLEAGAPPNEKPEKSNSPIHIASYWGNEPMVRLLLEHGAKVGDMKLHMRSEATYELLRQAKMREDGTEVPSYAIALADRKSAAAAKAQETGAPTCPNAQHAIKGKFETWGMGMKVNSSWSLGQ